MSWVQLALGLSASFVFLSGVALSVKKVVTFAWKTTRRVDEFLTDFYGEPATAVKEARPGVMLRLSTMETVQAEQSEMLKSIRDELQPNHGSSQRDDIARIHEAVTGSKPPIYEGR